MSSGSWGGAIPGTEPTGISPYSRQLFQNIYDGRWQNQTVIDYSDLSNRGTILKKDGILVLFKLEKLVLKIGLYYLEI